MNPNNDPQPVLDHIEPVLAVPDVMAAIKYWTEVLAFPNHWDWGTPPNHGGVSWGGTHLQFSLNPERHEKAKGSLVWIRVKYIDQLHKIHQERNAEIVDSLERRPWGLDEYCVKDLNGYYVVFSGHSAERKRSADTPDGIKIEARTPTAAEFLSLAESVAWTDLYEKKRMAVHLSAPVLSVVASDTKSGTIIGCALVLSDNSSFYYIKDVMVHRDWQGKRVGTALMKALSDWLDKNGIKKSLVGLYTTENLEPFYAQFGFTKAFGMVKRLN